MFEQAYAFYVEKSLFEERIAKLNKMSLVMLRASYSDWSTQFKLISEQIEKRGV